MKMAADGIAALLCTNTAAATMTAVSKYLRCSVSAIANTSSASANSCLTSCVVRVNVTPTKRAGMRHREILDEATSMSEHGIQFAKPKGNAIEKFACQLVHLVCSEIKYNPEVMMGYIRMMDPG